MCDDCARKPIADCNYSICCTSDGGNKETVVFKRKKEYHPKECRGVETGQWNIKEVSALESAIEE